MKRWLNQSKLVLKHSEENVFFQFFFWTGLFKLFMIIFVWNAHEPFIFWQLPYLQMLVTKYQTGPNVSKIEMNC